MTTYVAYIDDSGDEDYAVYAALLVPIETWTKTLRQWLTFRQNLYQSYSIPADYEIHCKDLIQAGKGTPAPSITYGVNTEASKRRKVLELATARIGSLAGIRMIAEVKTHSTPESCYRSLLKKIDAQMIAEDGWTMAVVDGNGSDGSHKTAHRALKLDVRRIIEDPWHQDSQLSQFVQMADVAAYMVFQAHRVRESRKQLWGWMSKHLHSIEVAGYCACPL
jgi:hypothetical protein